MKIPFARVDCSGNERKYMQEVIESGWLTTAGKAREFERRFAEAVVAKHAIAVNSCTSALHLAVEALGVKAGERVFVPTMTFTATAEVTRYMGADPLLLDVEYGTCLLTPEILLDAMRKHPEVKTLLVVHYGGQAAQMFPQEGQPGILEICRQHGVRVVEDAAHAFPSRLGPRMVGALGDITCFSFYANKTITTGEGGMITTDNDEYARRMGVMRLHGIDRDIWNRFTSEKPSWEYDVVAPGFKYNMPDVNAAIGLAQLERAEQMRKERERCARYYMEALRDIPWLDLPVVRVPFCDHAWHLFPIVVKPESPLSRDEVIERLSERGIATSVHYKPLHRMKYYRETYRFDPLDYPTAERVWRGCLSLPLYPQLKEEELEYISHELHRMGKKTTA